MESKGFPIWREYHPAKEHQCNLPEPGGFAAGTVIQCFEEILAHGRWRDCGRLWRNEYGIWLQVTRDVSGGYRYV